MNQDERQAVHLPWDYEPVADEALQDRADKYMKGHSEPELLDRFFNHQGCGMEEQKRRIATWILSYQGKKKYVKAIAKAADLTQQRCLQIYHRCMAEAWVAHQKKEKH